MRTIDEQGLLIRVNISAWPLGEQAIGMIEPSRDGRTWFWELTTGPGQMDNEVTKGFASRAEAVASLVERMAEMLGGMTSTNDMT